MSRILIIEPNKILAAQYAGFLSRAGHDVAVAYDAQSAINRTDKRTPDLVLLELLLSAHSGIEFLYEFRSYPEWRKVPVLVLSRLPQAELAANQAAYDRLGVVGYLYKPKTSLKQLGSKVKAATAVADTVG